MMVDWVYDELVLAADLVSRNGWKGVRAGTPEASELSSLLRLGQLHAGETLPANFRSTSSIQRKTADLVTADPAYAGKRTRGGRQDREVIIAFRSDTSGMQARAADIRAALESGEIRPAGWVVEDDAGSAEGGILEYVARRRERDPRARKRKLAAVMASGLPIACEVCGFDFAVAYGARGDGYIEVHHRQPLHVTGRTTTTLSDLVLLCANCHRMCHRGGWITPEVLRRAVAG